MACKSVIAAIVSRHSHNGSCTIARQYIIGNPNRNLLSRKRIDGIRTRKNSCYAAIWNSLTLGALFCTFQILLHSNRLSRRCQLRHQFALRCQYHKRNTKHRIGTSGKNRKLLFAVFYSETNLGSFGATYPIALRFFQRRSPVYLFQSVEQTLGISRYTQTPLTHYALFNRIAPAHRKPFAHLVVGKHTTQLRTPIHFCIGKVSNAIIHQYFLLLFFTPTFPFLGSKNRRFACGSTHFGIALLVKNVYQQRNRTGCIGTIAIPMIKHLLKSPLCPFIIIGIAGAYLTIPIVAKTYFVELFAITRDILFGSNGRVLTRLNGILLGRQPVRIKTHRMQYVITLQTLVAAIYVGSNITQRMPYMQTRSRRIREHIQYIKFRTVATIFHLVNGILFPISLPFLFDFSKVIFHTFALCLKCANLWIFMFKAPQAKWNLSARTTFCFYKK